MKTLIGIVALLVCSSGCIAESASDGTEDADSLTTAASADEGPESQDGADPRELAPAVARSSDAPGQCASCGPGPQPWHRTLEIHVEAR